MWRADFLAAEVDFHTCLTKRMDNAYDLALKYYFAPKIRENKSKACIIMPPPPPLFCQNDS